MDRPDGRHTVTPSLQGREAQPRAAAFGHNQLPGTRIYGLPMHTRRAAQVTIHSQQVRALNLIFALDQAEPLHDGNVVVVGGGIAGATAASAAALCGAHVVLLERAEEIMHMQLGCHSRYLHPNIFDWPRQSFVRATAHLPLLGWSVGTAHAVAERLVSQFERIKRALAKHERAGSLEVCTRVTAEILPSMQGARWTSLSGKPGLIESARAIIFACGFGVEKSIAGAAPSSYWRVDSLTQSPLFSWADKHELVIVGGGDGGITDVIRAKLKNFDHGSFVDACVQALEEVREEITRIESETRLEELRLRKEHQPDSVIEERISISLAASYAGLTEAALRSLDSAMGELRSGTRVTWITEGAPFSLRKQQSLNRVLVWRLLARGQIEHVRGRVLKATHDGARYVVTVDGSEDGVVADEVVPRIGAAATPAMRSKGAASPGLSVAEIVEALGRLPAEPAFEPLAESVYDYFAERVDRLGVSASDGAYRAGLRLKARMLRRASKPGLFTIQIWLEGCPEHILWADYDLHPEYGVVTRRAGHAPHFDHWLNSLDDFWIRVRLSDGFETGEWLTSAIEATGEQPQWWQEAVAALKGAAAEMRGDPAYRSRGWSSSVDAAAWLRSKGVKGGSPDRGGFRPIESPKGVPEH